MIARRVTPIGLCLFAIVVGCAKATGASKTPGRSISGTYQTHVSVVTGSNTCGDVTVMDNSTVISRHPGDSTFSLTHTAIVATGTVTKTGAFSTVPIVLALNDAQYTIGIAGQFSGTGFEATVHLDVKQTRTPTTCGYDVHWTGSK
jgi:hypothetical protein